MSILESVTNCERTQKDDSLEFFLARKTGGEGGTPEVETKEVEGGAVELVFDFPVSTGSYASPSFALSNGLTQILCRGSFELLRCAARRKAVPFSSEIELFDPEHSNWYPSAISVRFSRVAIPGCSVSCEFRLKSFRSSRIDEDLWVVEVEVSGFLKGSIEWILRHEDGLDDELREMIRVINLV